MPRDYDKPKRSWREIDKKKDGSQHRPAERKPFHPNQQARAESASKVYKSKLDAFFDGEGKAPAHVKEKFAAIEDTSKAGKERTAALKKIKDAGTSGAADKAIAAYLKKWELPPDFEILAQALMCGDESYVEQAMVLLEEMFKNNRVPKRTQLLEQRLRRVKTLIDDDDLEEKATHLIRTLRLFK